MTGAQLRVPHFSASRVLPSGRAQSPTPGQPGAKGTSLPKDQGTGRGRPPGPRCTFHRGSRSPRWPLGSGVGLLPTETALNVKRTQDFKDAVKKK